LNFSQDKLYTIKCITLNYVLKKYDKEQEKRYIKRAGQNWKISKTYQEDKIIGKASCGLMVRVSGYRYRGPGFDSRRYQIF